jgi:hypothetical protein
VVQQQTVQLLPRPIPKSSTSHARPTSPPTLNTAPVRPPSQRTDLHAVEQPQVEYFQGINYEKLSPFNQLCEKMYSNVATLNNLDLSQYPNLPSSDINLIKYFQENNNALDQALKALRSSAPISTSIRINNSNKSPKDKPDSNDTLAELIDKTNSALILLNESLFLDHLCQTIDPNDLSKIRLEQNITELQKQKKIIQSYYQRYQNKNIFQINKGFGKQESDPQAILEKFSNLRSEYFKYHFNDSNYLPYFISVLETIKDPQASLEKLRTEIQEHASSYSDQQLKDRINIFIQESLKQSKTLIQAEIQTSKEKLKSLERESDLKNKNIKPTIQPEDSFSKKAFEIGVGKFYLEFLNKISAEFHSSKIKKTSLNVKTEIKNNYVKYLQELVQHEQSMAQPRGNFHNLTANEIVPRLNFFPIAAPLGYSSKLLQFWENVLQNHRVSDEGYQCLLRNEHRAKQLSQSTHHEEFSLLTTGQNHEYLRQKDFEISTLGNYNETRFLLSLQTLAKNRNDLTIIVPNTVGWLNNKLKTDVIILKQDQTESKILAIDCKSSRDGCKQHNDTRRTPSIAYHPPRSNLYFNLQNQSSTNPNEELSDNLETLFESQGAYINLPITNDIKTNLTNSKIFSNPSKNFYQLQDTTEARHFEHTVSMALQEGYTLNSKTK